MLEILVLHSGKIIFLTGLVYLILVIYLVNRHLYLSRLLQINCEDVKEEIRTAISQQKSREFYTIIVDKLRAEAEIVYAEPEKAEEIINTIDN